MVPVEAPLRDAIGTEGEGVAESRPEGVGEDVEEGLGGAGKDREGEAVARTLSVEVGEGEAGSEVRGEPLDFAEREAMEAVELGEAEGDLLADVLGEIVEVGVVEGEVAEDFVADVVGADAEGRADCEPVALRRAAEETEGEPDKRAVRVDVTLAEEHRDADEVTEGESENDFEVSGERDREGLAVAEGDMAIETVREGEVVLL